MKNRIIIIVLLLCSFSCKKFLSEDSRSQIASEDFYKTKSDLTNAINGIYLVAHQPFQSSSIAGAGIPYTILDEVNGQNVDKTVLADNIRFNQLIYNNTSTNCQALWNSYYLGIEGANNVLANVSSVELSDADRKLITGQASFFRAYFYYNLVNIFGDVPLKLTPTHTPQDALLPKTVAKDIYNNEIVPDLLAAINSGMPASPAGNGFISTGAAQTLLAKVYLSMAGNPVNDMTKYGLARDIALQVINSGNFSLWQSDAGVTWFEKLNNPAFNNTQEAIWDLGFTKGSQNNNYVIFFLPSNTLGNPLITAAAYQSGGMSPSPAYLNSYAANDLRGKHQFGFWYNQLILPSQTITFQDWSSNKFFDKTTLSPGNASLSGLNYHVLRYADLLLTYAEAQNEADGAPNTAAYHALNSIRERAGLADISGLNQDAFRQEVWKQRYWELDLEGWLWFDMVRTHKMFSGTGMVEAVGFTMPGGAVFKEENLKFPIPLSEININPLLK